MTPMPESMDTVRVPRVPTEAMYEAAAQAWQGALSTYWAREMWDAMLSAAPTPPAVSGVREALERDAARWRALMSSDRIRMMGAAGFDFADDGSVTVRGDGCHMGVEVWDRHPAKDDDSDTRGRKVLLAYVDHRIAALASLAPDGSAGK